MPLASNSYGKSAVRLTKVVRDGQRHTLFEIDAAIELEGDFTAAYTDGDNRNVIATDTIKNTVYVVAKENAFDSIEAFAVILCRHFIKTYQHVSAVKVELAQAAWQRIVVDGVPHDHAFTGAAPQRRVCRATLDRASPQPDLRGGVRDLLVLKTTGSAWKDFHADRCRTLPDSADRLLATKIDADWTYNKLSGDFDAWHASIEAAMLRTFATRESLGVQQTLVHIGEAAMAVCPAIDRIDFTLPNLHRIPFNLDPFGLKFEQDIYVATDQPFGVIKGRVVRGERNE